MKQFFIGALGTTLLVALPAQRSLAQIPVLEVIRQAVVKVIKAVDLQIQRLQNKTIWLQNAQRELENKMQQHKLEEITSWVERQRALYAGYYEELWRVKAALSYYSKVRDIIQKGGWLVEQYQKTLALLRQDRRFTPGELQYMETVLEGILRESAQSLDQLYLIADSYRTQMTDGQRLELLAGVDRQLEGQLRDLRRFREGAVRLSLARAKDGAEIQQVKTLYGIR